jgi:hypothetical protein
MLVAGSYGVRNIPKGTVSNCANSGFVEGSMQSPQVDTRKRDLLQMESS